MHEYHSFTTRYSDIIQECWFENPSSRITMETAYISLKKYYDSAGHQSAYYDEDELARATEEYYYDDASTLQYGMKASDINSYR